MCSHQLHPPPSPHSLTNTHFQPSHTGLILLPSPGEITCKLFLFRRVLAGLHEQCFSHKGALLMISGLKKGELLSLERAKVVRRSKSETFLLWTGARRLIKPFSFFFSPSSEVFHSRSRTVAQALPPPLGLLCVNTSVNTWQSTVKKKTSLWGLSCVRVSWGVAGFCFLV